MIKILEFRTLPNADLIVDAVYEGEPGGLLSGDALSRLLPGVVIRAALEHRAEDMIRISSFCLLAARTKTGRTTWTRRPGVSSGSVTTKRLDMSCTQLSGGATGFFAAYLTCFTRVLRSEGRSLRFVCFANT